MQAAYYAIHYGTEYLAASIRSIQDAVDEIHIFYVDRPSYGHDQGASCPDSKSDLQKEAHYWRTSGYLDAKSVFWHDCGPFRGEAEHRNHAVEHLRSRGAHQILVVDADEVWPDGVAKQAVYEATHANRVRNWSARFVHFFRSVRYAVRDHFLPIRILDLRHEGGTDTVEAGPVLHFGYAQREALIRYKWTCHGHQAELRPGWLDRFSAWTPESTDLHPVVIDLWGRAERTDEALTAAVNVALRNHPYLDLEKIP